MGFSRQEYWSGLLFPPSGDLPHPRIKTRSPVSSALASGFFTTARARDSYLCILISFTHTHTHTHTHTPQRWLQLLTLLSKWGYWDTERSSQLVNCWAEMWTSAEWPHSWHFPLLCYQSICWVFIMPDAMLTFYIALFNTKQKQQQQQNPFCRYRH